MSARFFSVVLGSLLVFLISGFSSLLQASDPPKEEWEELKIFTGRDTLTVGFSYEDQKGRRTVWGTSDILKNQALLTVSSFSHNCSLDLPPTLDLYESLRLSSEISLEAQYVFDSLKEMELRHWVSQRAVTAQIAALEAFYLNTIQSYMNSDDPSRLLSQGFSQRFYKRLQSINKSWESLREQQQELQNVIDILPRKPSDPSSVRQNDSSSGGENDGDLDDDADEEGQSDQDREGEDEDATSLKEKNYQKLLSQLKFDDWDEEEESDEEDEPDLPEHLQKQKEALENELDLLGKNQREFQQEVNLHCKKQFYTLLKRVLIPHEHFARLLKPSFITPEDFNFFYHEAEDLRILVRQADSDERALRRQWEVFNGLRETSQGNQPILYSTAHLKTYCALSVPYQRIENTLRHQQKYQTLFSSRLSSLPFASQKAALLQKSLVEKGNEDMSKISAEDLGERLATLKFLLDHTLVREKVETYQEKKTRVLIALAEKEKKKAEEERQEERDLWPLRKALGSALKASKLEVMEEAYESLRAAQKDFSNSFDKGLLQKAYQFFREHKNSEEKCAWILEAQGPYLNLDQIQVLLTFYLKNNQEEKVKEWLDTNGTYLFIDNDEDNDDFLMRRGSESLLRVLRKYGNQKQKEILETCLWNRLFPTPLTGSIEDFPEEAKKQQGYALKRLQEIPKTKEEKTTRSFLVYQYVRLMPDPDQASSQEEFLKRLEERANFECGQGFSKGLFVQRYGAALAQNSTAGEYIQETMQETQEPFLNALTGESQEDTLAGINKWKESGDLRQNLLEAESFDGEQIALARLIFTTYASSLAGDLTGFYEDLWQKYQSEPVFLTWSVCLAYAYSGVQSYISAPSHGYSQAQKALGIFILERILGAYSDTTRLQDSINGAYGSYDENLSLDTTLSEMQAKKQSLGS